MLRNDEGFTLTELLVALTLTGLLSLGIGSFISSASANLNNSVESSVTAQMALRTAKLLRYDFAGSNNVYVFGPAAPADKTKVSYQLCYSDPAATSAGWGTGTAWATTVSRLLFSVDVVEMDETAVASPTWYQQRRQLIGYEIKRNAKDGQFELWRNVCTGNLLTYGMELDTTKSQRVITLGKSLPATVAGTTTLQCTTSSGASLCPEYNPTASSTTRPYYYSFLFPYSDTGRLVLLRNLVDPLVGRLAPKVESYR